MYRSHVSKLVVVVVVVVVVVTVDVVVDVDVDVDVAVVVVVVGVEGEVEVEVVDVDLVAVGVVVGVIVLVAVVVDVVVDVVVVVMVHRPPSNDAGVPSQSVHLRLLVAVAGVSTNCPGRHSRIRLHTLFFFPGCGALNSYSPSTHSPMAPQMVS